MSAIVLSVKDNLLSLVVAFLDPTLVWESLRNTYERGGASQILLATSQMNLLKMLEGVMEENLTTARDLKNRLAGLGQRWMTGLSCNKCSTDYLVAMSILFQA